MFDRRIVRGNTYAREDVLPVTAQVRKNSFIVKTIFLFWLFSSEQSDSSSYCILIFKNELIDKSQVELKCVYPFQFLKQLTY